MIPNIFVIIFLLGLRMERFSSMPIDNNIFGGKTTTKLSVKETVNTLKETNVDYTCETTSSEQHMAINIHEDTKILLQKEITVTKTGTLSEPKISSNKGNKNPQKKNCPQKIHSKTDVKDKGKPNQEIEESTEEYDDDSEETSKENDKAENRKDINKTQVNTMDTEGNILKRLENGANNKSRKKVNDKADKKEKKNEAEKNKEEKEGDKIGEEEEDSEESDEGMEGGGEDDGKEQNAGNETKASLSDKQLSKTAIDRQDIKMFRNSTKTPLFKPSNPPSFNYKTKDKQHLETIVGSKSSVPHLTNSTQNKAKLDEKIVNAGKLDKESESDEYSTEETESEENLTEETDSDENSSEEKKNDEKEENKKKSHNETKEEGNSDEETECEEESSEEPKNKESGKIKDKVGRKESKNSQVPTKTVDRQSKQNNNINKTLSLKHKQGNKHKAEKLINLGVQNSMRNVSGIYKTPKNSSKNGIKLNKSNSDKNPPTNSKNDDFDDYKFKNDHQNIFGQNFDYEEEESNLMSDIEDMIDYVPLRDFEQYNTKRHSRKNVFNLFAEKFKYFELVCEWFWTNFSKEITTLTDIRKSYRQFASYTHKIRKDLGAKLETDLNFIMNSGKFKGYHIGSALEERLLDFDEDIGLVNSTITQLNNIVNEIQIKINQFKNNIKELILKTTDFNNQIYSDIQRVKLITLIAPLRLIDCLSRSTSLSQNWRIVMESLYLRGINLEWDTYVPLSHQYYSNLTAWNRVEGVIIKFTKEAERFTSGSIREFENLGKAYSCARNVSSYISSREQDILEQIESHLNSNDNLSL